MTFPKITFTRKTEKKYGLRPAAIPGLEIRFFVLLVKPIINTKIYCFKIKFN